MACVSKPIENLGGATAGKVPPNEVNSDLRLDLKERTKALFEGLQLVCEEHSMPSHLIKDLKKQVVSHFKKIDWLVFYGGTKKEKRRIRQVRKRPFTEDELNDQLLAEQVWVEECKFLLTYPMARFLKNETPIPPESGGVKFTGAVKRWLKARMNAFNLKNVHLWYSWFQAKRACLPFSELQMPVLFEEHCKALTKPDPYDKGFHCLTVHSIMENDTFSEVLSGVARGVIDHLMTYDGYINYHGQKTNQHASWEATRGYGGSVTQLRRVCGIREYWQEREHHDSVDEPILHSMDFVPCFRNKDGTTSFNVVLKKTTSPLWEDWESLPTDRMVRETDESHGRMWEWFDAYLNFKAGEGIDPGSCPDPEFRTIGENENLQCLVAGVLEPNKCRMISKGEAQPYYLCKSLQKALLRSIQKYECFKLTGRPFCPTDLYPLLEKAKKDDLWLSVDYSAATDGLSYKLSRMIMDRCLELIPNNLRMIAHKVLGPHDLFYPTSDGGKRYGGTMTNGQLMGSILSFPILCLANLGLYLHVNEDNHRGWKSWEKLRHVLINGDDMLYTADEDTFNDHIHLGGKIGLKMSSGKAYSHRSYANINSTSVVYDLRRLKDLSFKDFEAGVEGKWSLYGPGTESPRLIPFLNVGLALNRHKVQGRTDEQKDLDLEKKIKYLKKIRGDRQKQIDYHLDEIVHKRFFGLIQFQSLYAESHTHEDSRSGIVENIPLALEGCLNERSKRRLLGFILKYHESEIKRQTLVPAIDKSSGKHFLGTKNLFLPLPLGGMGIMAPIGFKFKVTPFQRYLAHSNLGSNQFSVRPFNRVFEMVKALDYVVEPFDKPPQLFFKEPVFIQGGSGSVCKGIRRFNFWRSFQVSEWSSCFY